MTRSIIRVIQVGTSCVVKCNVAIDKDRLIDEVLTEIGVPHSKWDSTSRRERESSYSGIELVHVGFSPWWHRKFKIVRDLE